MVGEGRLEIVAGRIVSAREIERRRSRSNTAGAARSQIRRPRAFAYAFNCTGPLHSIARTRDPLLRSLLDAGQVRPDQLGIGLEVDDALARRRAVCGRWGR